MLWTASSAKDLGTLDRDWGFAYGLNESGDVVGNIWDTFLPRIAVLWQGGEAYQLDDHVCGLGTTRLRNATRINERGEILVFIDGGGQLDTGALLIPQSHPQGRCIRPTGLNAKR